MNQDSQQIIKKLKELKPLLQKELGIIRLRVFGSVARGDAGPDSDVDLISDFEVMPGLSFFSMDEKISALIGGRKVDLFTENGIDKYIRKRVLREAVDVF